MTWVIGMPSLFGYAVGMADIQVTFPNGQTLDCLQKIYPVGNYLGAGFCGSVRIGLELIENLTRGLHSAGGGGWMPRYVAFQWYRRARRIFASRSSPEEKRLGCAIMLFGASPRENLGDAPWARSDVIVLDSRRDFFPQIGPRNQCISMGSGNGVEVYMRELARFNNEPFQHMQVEVGGPGTGGFALVSALAMAMRENPVAGISEYVHCLLAFRGRVDLKSFEYSEFDERGLPIPRKMPEVARGWVEFENRMRQLGYAAALACA